MGTSASNKGGSGGAWTSFKRDASYFARLGGEDRAARALAGSVEAGGGAAASIASAMAGVRTAQSLGGLLAASGGADGLAAGLDAIGLGHLVGESRFTILGELLDTFAGAGSDLESQAARDALLDVLDEVLPDDGTGLDAVVIDNDALADVLNRYIGALVYNRAIPIIDERLTRLNDPLLAQERDKELRDFISALVQLRTSGGVPIDLDWAGRPGRDFVEGILRAVYDQLEEW